MKIRYFPDTDTLYIELADRVSSNSESVSDNLIVDFDELGKPVGVTLEHYSQISDTSTINTRLPITPALQPAQQNAERGFGFSSAAQILLDRGHHNQHPGPATRPARAPGRCHCDLY